MGKIIACWSPVAGHSGNTANIVALSSILALRQSFRSLLTHTKPHHTDLEFQYHKASDTGLNESGMKALEKLAKSNLISPDNIEDYSESIYKSRLDFLSGQKKVSPDTSECERVQVVKNILLNAKNGYDFLWLDLKAGLDNELDKDIMAFADLIVISLPQNKYIVESFFENGMPIEFINKEVVFVVGKYEQKSAYSVRNIKRQNKIVQPLLEIPYTNGYTDAINQRNLMEFFYRANKNKKGDDLYKFVQSVSEVNDTILKKLSIEKAEDDWA